MAISVAHQQHKITDARNEYRKQRVKPLNVGCGKKSANKQAIYLIMTGAAIAVDEYRVYSRVAMTVIR